MSTLIQLEIFIDKDWKKLGVIEVFEEKDKKSYLAPVHFNYDFEYLDSHGEHLLSNGFYAASLCCPLSYEPYSYRKWPSFLLDLIPTGVARKNWLKRLQLPDVPSSDLELLANGAINPPGNIRVKSKYTNIETTNKHPGFSRKEIISRGIDFIDYAEQLGAMISGSSGAQGEAPKFMLVQDEKGNWHGDGAISEDRIINNWIVKFPRGKKKRDYQILKLEAIYYEIARELGVRAHGPLRWEKDTLFIPRFDRIIPANRKPMLRLGLESIVSSTGISEFGAMVPHETYLEQIKKFCSIPEVEIKEYIFRDFLNIVCGNTDNHGRNTALLKYPDGKVELSPLYDFAPMVLDDAGIVRASRWRDEIAQIPDFQKIAALLFEYELTENDVNNFFSNSYDKLRKLPALMKAKRVDMEVAEFVTKKYDLFISKLKNYLKKQTNI